MQSNGALTKKKPNISRNDVSKVQRAYGLFHGTSSSELIKLHVFKSDSCTLKLSSQNFLLQPVPLGTSCCSQFFILRQGSLPSSDNCSKVLGLLRISDPLPWDFSNVWTANYAMGILLRCKRRSACWLSSAVSKAGPRDALKLFCLLLGESVRIQKNENTQ